MVKFKIEHRVISGALFALYIVALIYFMFFAEILGRTTSLQEYHYNLIPFKEISRFITYSGRLGFGAVFANLVGNVVAFIPFGMFLPVISNHKRKLFGMTLLSFELSLLIEVTQLVSKAGSFDVDDLILNTLGGLLGYCLFKWIYWYRIEKEKRHEQSKIQ